VVESIVATGEGSTLISGEGVSELTGSIGSGVFSTIGGAKDGEGDEVIAVLG
jgi:hypothetical protein